MSLLIFIVVVLVILALALWAVDYLPLPNSTITNLIRLLLVVIAIIVIVQRAGVL